MRNRIFIAFFIVALAILGASVLWAQGMNKQHQEGLHPANCTMGGANASQTKVIAASQCPIMGDLPGTLQLTDSQVKQVKDIQAKAHQAMMPYHQTMAEKQRALTDALKAEKPDAAAIQQLVADQGAAMTACRQTMVDAHLALKGVLTTEQAAKLPTCPMLSAAMTCEMPGHDGTHMTSSPERTTGQQTDHSQHH